MNLQLVTLLLFEKGRAVGWKYWSERDSGFRRAQRMSVVTVSLLGGHRWPHTSGKSFPMTHTHTHRTGRRAVVGPPREVTAPAAAWEPARPIKVPILPALMPRNHSASQLDPPPCSQPRGLPSNLRITLMLTMPKVTLNAGPATIYVITRSC